MGQIDVAYLRAASWAGRLVLDKTAGCARQNPRPFGDAAVKGLRLRTLKLKNVRCVGNSYFTS